MSSKISLKKEEVEKIAYNNLGITKIEEDLYNIPDVRFITGSTQSIMFEEEHGKGIEHLNYELTKGINEIVNDSGDTIAITIEKETENNIKLLKFKNLDTGCEFKSTIQSEFDDESRYKFVGYLTTVVHKNNVALELSLKGNYETVKKLSII